MASATETRLLPLIHQLARSGEVGRATDGQLLDWFLTFRQEAAFRALVDRHGSMVMGVCRRVLRDTHDAEDAFQATFLVLARKAASVVPRDLVGNWLYGVAYRTAQKARVSRTRAHAAKRRAFDRVAAMTRHARSDDEIWHDLQPVLDEELERLPAAYRAAIVLCDLEGKSRKEAARHLGWPEGTLSGRLARARKQLAERLTRRGVTLSAAAWAAAVTKEAAAATVPASIKSSVTKVAVLTVAGQALPAGIISTQVSALTEGVMKTMLIAKLRVGVLVLMAIGLVASGTGLVARQVVAAGTPQPEAVKPLERVDGEMHVIGVYAAKDGLAKAGRVNVEVRPTAKPVVLVLTSYYPVDWRVKLAAGARIAQVIVSGYNPQEVRGVPADVPVVNRSYYPNDGSRRKDGWFYSHEWNTPQSREMVRRLNDMTGLPVASFQSSYEGEWFIVDGQRGRELGQKELKPRVDPKEPTPEELKAASVGAELHVVGMYVSNGQPVDVEVKATAKPVVLVLTSYMDAIWNLRPAAGAKIRAVVLCGYFPQEVDGVPAGVPVHHYCPDAASHSFEPRPSPRTKGRFYAYKANTLEYRRMVETLNDATGLMVSSFQGEERGTSFVVDGTRGRDLAQKERKPRPPLPKPVKPEDLRAAAAGADLHLVSIYQSADRGNGAPVEVEVRATDKPVVLAVASYNSVLWKVKVADGVRLKAVIVGGYFEQEFEGIPAGVPVVYRAYFPGQDHGYFYAHKRDIPEYGRTIGMLKDLTGLRVATSQVELGGKSFVVDGTRGREFAQKEGTVAKADAPGKEPPADAPADVADIPSQDRQAGDAAKRYFLIGPKKDAKPPAEGYGLVVVLPGGDGSADFQPFVKRIAKNALSERYVVAQPVARKWTLDQQIVWPTKANPVEKMAFGTEEFIAAVVDDVAKQFKLDRTRVFTLSWSSSGPAAYATSLQPGHTVTGSLIAMSVFNPKFLPPLAAAKGHAYYLYHSPQDRVCPHRMAERAKDDLTANGAKVRLETYDGGHGWRGDVYNDIRAGVEWLEANREAPGR